MELPSCLNELDKLILHMDSPRVVVENDVCPNATIVKIDSARKYRLLLEYLQLIIDLNLSIKKAYISCDGKWAMDVFHVTDLHGNKLKDQNTISYMEQSIGSIIYRTHCEHKGITTLELSGADKIGLLSQVFAVLSGLNCSVVDANVWTHNGRIASLIFVKHCESNGQLEDKDKCRKIMWALKHVLKGDSVKVTVSTAVTHTERRLHQMMFDDGDYVRNPSTNSVKGIDDIDIRIVNRAEKGYSFFIIQCKDRPKLLFDVVCALKDLEYVVFHAMVNTQEGGAYLEFYIRHSDGTPISCDAERQVIQCLKAAILRRESKGVRLELHTKDKPYLLANVTKIFQQNCLSIARAEISTMEDMAQNIFYVTDAEGYTPDTKIIDSIRKKIGLNNLKVTKLPTICHQNNVETNEEGSRVGFANLLSLGNARKNVYNLVLRRTSSMLGSFGKYLLFGLGKLLLSLYRKVVN